MSSVEYNENYEQLRNALRAFYARGRFSPARASRRPTASTRCNLPDEEMAEGRGKAAVEDRRAPDAALAGHR
eukprot:16450843-Heterocapsa_arctica.AAC.1